VRGEVWQAENAVINATLSFTLASDEYAKDGKVRKAWECKYRAAYVFYKAGQMDHAIASAMDAAKLLLGCEPEGELLALSQYIIGCAYFAKGDLLSAKTFFMEGESSSSHLSDMKLRSLLGQSSCLFNQGEWKQALEVSQKAVTLCDRHAFWQLKAEALVLVMACHVRMGQHNMADNVFSQAVSIPGISLVTKSKIYREMIFNAKEHAPDRDTARYEVALRELLTFAQFPNSDWDRLKSEWALEQCRLLREFTKVKETVTAYASAFRDISRIKDAFEILVFGATLLKK